MIFVDLGYALHDIALKHVTLAPVAALFVQSISKYNLKVVTRKLYLRFVTLSVSMVICGCRSDKRIMPSIKPVLLRLIKANGP